MATTIFLTSLLLLGAGALSPSNPPGKNFDLTPFTLQLPSGTTGHPDSISASKLASYTNADYFFTDSTTGALTMKVPGTPANSACVTTANSLHCRTELRESSPASWSPKDAVNRLAVSLTVVDAGGSVCIGQIHIDDDVSVRPVAELYYKDGGAITMGVEHTLEGGDQTSTTIGNVAVGTPFTYEIRYEGGELSVQVNDGGFKTLSTYDLDSPKSYFKVGNYLQGSSASEVQFSSIAITHGDSGNSSSSSDEKRATGGRRHARAMGARSC